jgi:predicted unusual protein kinase regulating ubiquinone biosynthesis (AarF/ABC1/UbiB family)
VTAPAAPRRHAFDRTGRQLLLERLRRTARVWRLTARNAARFVVHRVRRRFAPRHQRAAIDDAFSLSTADDVARELGNMKGALMKAGQLVSFVVEALPEAAQQSLAQLYSDAPPMSSELAASVVREAFGRDPEQVFLDWQPHPVAAASIGQVHRAVTRDGREVAVKVQYPGVARAIESDLANADVLYRMIGAFTLKGLDTRALVDELRVRMRDELDYTIEAANLHEFRRAFHGHPFVRLPDVVDEWSRRTVITTEWIEGLSWGEFVARATPEARRRAGESIWRFAQHAILRLGVFNGDPHPGNYRFSAEGDVTFLDFGMVKRWAPGEWERLAPCMDAIIVERDPVALVAAMESSGFLRPHHGLDPQAVYDYVSSPYRPYLTDRFRFTRDFMRDTVQRIIDVNGPHAAVIAQVDMPPSFVMLDRVVWGVSALLGKLDLEAPWRAMLLEYRTGAPPATELGEAEQRWRLGRP